MSRTGYFGVMVAALENGCPSIAYHVTCWDTPEKAAVGFLRGRAKELGLSLSDGSPRGAAFRRLHAYEGDMPSILSKRTFTLLKVTLGNFQKQCTDKKILLKQDGSWTISELKLKDCEEAAASTAQLKITQSEALLPPEDQVPAGEQPKASFVHIFWRVGSACDVAAKALINKNSHGLMKKPPPKEQEVWYLFSDFHIAAMLGFLANNWSHVPKTCEIPIHKVTLSDSEFLSLRHVPFQESPLSEFWLSPDAFPSQSVMACVELDEGNYQSLKDLKKSEAQRLAQKRVRELSAFILEQEDTLKSLRLELKEATAAVEAENPAEPQNPEPSGKKPKTSA